MSVVFMGGHLSTAEPKGLFNTLQIDSSSWESTGWLPLKEK